MATAEPLPPGPPPGGLLGHYGAFRRDPLRFLLQARRDHGPVVRIRMGLRDVYLLTDPRAVHEVLVEHHRHVIKDWRERDLRWVMGQGLLLSEGDFWRRQRQLVQPAFHRQRVLGYGDEMAQVTAARLGAWRDGAELDVARAMTELTLAIVCRTLLGFDAHAEGREVARLLGPMMEYMARRANLPMPTWVPIPGDAGFQRQVRELQRMIDRIVEGRRADPGKHDDLLAMLLAAQAPEAGGMGDAQLRDEVMTMFLAGHETTATALTWLWHVVGQRADVEAKLLAEHRAVLGDRVPGGADVPKLRYTDQVVRETMRLYPPAWMFGREVVQPFEAGGVRFPRGATLWFSPYVNHRDPAWFPEPEAFRPERWTPELLEKLPEFAYFPFGGGPRVCVGQPFALMELPLVVATILPRWRIEPLEREVEALPSVTLRPRRGLRARVRRR